MNGLPSRCSSFWPMIRAIRPVEPPGANGTTKVTGRLGYWLALSWAWAIWASRQPATAATKTAFIGNSPGVSGLRNITLTRRNPDEIRPSRVERCSATCVIARRYRRNETEPCDADVQPRRVGRDGGGFRPGAGKSAQRDMLDGCHATAG